MKKIKLQAHKGVASECPENTMSAFRCAALQGYDVIELDLGYTLDKKIVVLHDETINRTARFTNGMQVEEKIYLNKIIYSEALNYDYGIWFSNKYASEKIPLFEDVLRLSKSQNIRLKIDNKIQKFPLDVLDLFFLEIKDYLDYVSLTSNDIEFIKYSLDKCQNNLRIDYDGVVTEDILRELTRIVPYEKLTVWLPYECKSTLWVKIPFASQELVSLVKKYAKLGIWIINDYESYYQVVRLYNPDIIETNGTVKPINSYNHYYDMHTHSKNSHDSNCEVREMVQKAKEKGLCGFAVTDHCDIEYYDRLNLHEIIKNSYDDASKIKEINCLKGIEIGEAIWHKDVTNNIIQSFSFDVVIGSIHAVRYEDYEKPYSRIDFSKMSTETIEEYLKQYFIDMLEMVTTCNIDILAHITCPFRYINGKFERNIDCKKYEVQIKEILAYIIKHKIALEVNTSCVYENSKYKEYMPEKWIIELYKDMGGYLVTTASDAHISEKVGNDFDKLYETLKEIGFNNIYYYYNRYPIQCTLIKETNK